MSERTVCTFRQVSEYLWVSDRDSAVRNANNVAVIIDCLGNTTYNGTPAKILRAQPTGRTRHRWTVADLDKVAGIITQVWEKHPGCRVLVHCKRGVSRSACAAAAILLAAGLVQSLEEAMEAVGVPGEQVSRHSLKGLQEWWAARQPQALSSTYSEQAREGSSRGAE